MLRASALCLLVAQASAFTLHPSSASGFLAPFAHAFGRSEVLALNPARRNGAAGRVGAGPMSLACNTGTEDYKAKWGNREPTWSNPSGLTLTPVRDNVWAGERPFVWNNIDVGGKMTVARLSDGALWVHSPIDLDADTKAAVDELGPVKHIISPNYEHVKWAQQWIDAYPEAVAWACPGAKEKFPDISFTKEIGWKAPEEWLGEIDSAWFDCEKNPFTGTPFFNEVVFYHKPSKVMMCADLWWNWPSKVPGGTRAWKFGMDQVYRPFYLNLMADSRRLKRDAQKMLDWDFDCLLPCHGRVVADEVIAPELKMDDELYAAWGGDLKGLLKDHLKL